jgi:oxepin-CoA hydrolase/3-oxo-5,6-dehydrosuberyl-CoA semialdehyde dehydrogenase
VRFDVNDAALRESFLRDEFLGLLAALEAATPARWGAMTAQQMVEHMEWVFAISNGRVLVECPVPEAERERVKPFLRSTMPTPREFQNPLLVGGLPPLRHADLAAARAALGGEVARFFAHTARDASAMHTHPVFGPIGAEDWSRAHYKHAHHHLLQFGLIAEPERPPRKASS